MTMISSSIFINDKTEIDFYAQLRLPLVFYELLYEYTEVYCRQRHSFIKEDVKVFLHSEENISILSTLENHCIVLSEMIFSGNNPKNPEKKFQSIMRQVLIDFKCF